MPWVLNYCKQNRCSRLAFALHYRFAPEETLYLYNDIPSEIPGMPSYSVRRKLRAIQRKPKRDVPKDTLDDVIRNRILMSSYGMDIKYDAKEIVISYDNLLHAEILKALLEKDFAQFSQTFLLPTKQIVR